MTEKKKVPIGVWIAEMRPEFFTATAMTVIVTCAMIWNAFGSLNWLNAILTMLAAMIANFATNAINDYWDHVSGCDEKNETPVRPFTGGSRLIQSGALTPKGVFRFAIFLFCLSAAIGVYLYLVSGIWTLVIGAAGILIGYFYTAKPVELGSTGLGEIITGLTCGALVALATFYIQTGMLSWHPVIVTAPISILVGLILYVNEFPDRVADEAAGKRHLIVRLGADRAAKLHFFLILTPFIALGCGLLFAGMPVWTSLGFLALPIFMKSNVELRTNYLEPAKLAGACGMTIVGHIVMSLLMAVGFII